VTPDRDILIKWHSTQKKRNQLYTTDRLEVYILLVSTSKYDEA
jgi:hypothetical protein